ncbi:MAG TPA: TetR/AcrR family transcriptional regulator [Rhizomicrobium sp.]
MTDEAGLKEPKCGGKPWRDERRDAIVEVAKQAFVEFGYAGTSMSAIAARVGGSKATLYNYFKSKEELFVAVVEKKCETIQCLLNQAEIEAGGDLRTALTNFGQRFLELILSDDSIATYRLATAEAARFPEIGRALYNSGPRQTKSRMAEFLKHAMDAGQLRRDIDVATAVNHFFGMCVQDIQQRRLWGAITSPSCEEIRTEVASAVTTFMRAFGTPPQ